MASGASTTRGGDCDRWELQVRGGLLGSARMRAAVEEHGAGRQLLRARVWPRLSGARFGLIVLLGALAVGAALDGALAAGALLGIVALSGVFRGLLECAAAVGAFHHALARLRMTGPGMTPQPGSSKSEASA